VQLTDCSRDDVRKLTDVVGGLPRVSSSSTARFPRHLFFVSCDTRRLIPQIGRGDSAGALAYTRSIIASGRDPNLRAAATKLRDRITRSNQ